MIDNLRTWLISARERADICKKQDLSEMLLPAVTFRFRRTHILFVAGNNIDLFFRRNGGLAAMSWDAVAAGGSQEHYFPMVSVS